MKKWSHVLSAAILTVGICLGYGQEAQAMEFPGKVLNRQNRMRLSKRSLQWPVEFLSNWIRSKARTLPTPPMERWTRPMWNLLGC